MTAGKHIGIAAITAEGAALAYTEIVHAAERILGANTHPEITMHSFSLSDFLAVKDDARHKVWADLMVRSSQKLASVGAAFFICPANTNHIVCDEVRDRVAIPWLHIAEIVVQEALRHQCKRTLVLGTQFLMQSEVYSSRFSPEGIETVVPNPDEQQMLHRIIYNELVPGLILPASKAAIHALIREYQKTHNCDSVVLACTELPLLLDSTEIEIVALDSTRLVAQGAVAYSLGMQLPGIVCRCLSGS